MSGEPAQSVSHSHHWKKQKESGKTPLEQAIHRLILSGLVILITTIKKLTEGGHRTNHEVRITLKPKWVEPYVKYTFGEHRVSPGSTKISEENSVELGINFNF
jgi:hypothetical protein